VCAALFSIAGLHPRAPPFDPLDHTTVTEIPSRDRDVLRNSHKNQLEAKRPPQGVEIDMYCEKIKV
jgi:hypothetical protein